MKAIRPLFLAAVLAVAVPTVATARLATLTKLHVFNRTDDGYYPAAPLIRAADGNFYGTVLYDYQNHGLIYRITPGGEYTALHVFDGKDSANPRAPLLQAADGDFYGTTASGYGDDRVPATIFRMKADGTLTTIHRFGDDVYDANALIQAADGNFYGTTSGGRTRPARIFKATPDGKLTTLHTFSDEEGAYTEEPLVQGRDGAFYGTTRASADGNRTLFRITAEGLFTVLHRFDIAVEGVPLAPLIAAADGDLYGTTYYGGGNGRGTVFKITTDGVLTTLHAFAKGEGAHPEAALVQVGDGSFYGTTKEGGGYDGHGTIYRMTPDGALATIYTFHNYRSYTYNSEPRALVVGDGGSLYGVTTTGGKYNYGSVYRLDPFVFTGPPVVTLNATAPSVPVSNVTYALFEVRLSHPAYTDLHIDYTVAGSATPGRDYGRLSGTVTLKAGQTYQSIGVFPFGDLGGAAKKSLKLTLEPSGGYTVGTEGLVKVRFTQP